MNFSEWLLESSLPVILNKTLPELEKNNFGTTSVYIAKLPTGQQITFSVYKKTTKNSSYKLYYST